ncbi:MAG: MBL fold metallo-hydrolase [Deltaproteobacteria bacterium]|nr:MBL fold metallo-hydrolase [Deltaproteobacteria bacterium]
MVKVHHLNCGSMCPLGGRLTLGAHTHLCCHCLLLELPDGLVLVDTGFGLDDVADARRLGGIFRCTARPLLSESECALRQVEQLAFSGQDVRHVLLTHLDVDHAGGLVDFPHAVVHVMRREHEIATDPSALGARARARYQQEHFQHDVRWDLCDAGGEPWMGFSQVVQPAGLPPEVLMVPLVGHSAGHAAIAVQSPDGWLMHAGDAYFHRGEVCAADGPIPWGLRLLARTGQFDVKQRVENISRLQRLVVEHPEVELFCAHDPGELGPLKEISL